MQYRISLIVLLGLISDATGAGPFVNPSQTRIGVTRRGTPIGCLITADDLNLATT